MMDRAIMPTLRRTSQQALRARRTPFSMPRAPAQRAFHIRQGPPSLLRTSPSPSIAHTGQAARPWRQQLRLESSAAGQPKPLTDNSGDSSIDPEDVAARKAQEPAYDMTFTCRKCLHRSTHRITKQAYHFGTTLVTCPGCKNRHLISDHLKVFSDTGVTLEDILREKGRYLKKGRLGEDGDIEFYDDENPVAESEGRKGN